MQFGLFPRTLSCSSYETPNQSGSNKSPINMEQVTTISMYTGGDNGGHSQAMGDLSWATICIIQEVIKFIVTENGTSWEI